MVASRGLIAMKLVIMMMALLAISFHSVSADPDLLQDICVADLTSGIFLHQTQISFSSDFVSGHIILCFCWTPMS